MQFVGSFFGGIMFYLLNDDNYVGLYGRLSPIGKLSDSTRGRMSHDWFFVIFNIFIFCGDSFSRKLVYWHRQINPLWYLIISVIGTALNLSQVPIFSWPGIFLVYYANGAVYGTSTRYIDANVAKRFNLIALSFWLFIGDMGSVTGSNIWQSVQDKFCDGVHDHLKYMCVPDKSLGSC